MHQNASVGNSSTHIIDFSTKRRRRRAVENIDSTTRVIMSEMNVVLQVIENYVGVVF
jgi:hypothetical protein